MGRAGPTSQGGALRSWNRAICARNWNVAVLWFLGLACQSLGCALPATPRQSELFKSHPKSKDHFIRRHGIFSIIELLEVDSADVVLSILQVVNQVAPSSVRRNGVAFLLLHRMALLQTD